ncbi:MAG: GNAT family N-acetyltransferase [Bellilinea sp.]
MTFQPISVARLSPPQTGAVAQAMSRAFFNDPMFTYILPNEQARSEKMPRFFRAILAYGLRYGEVYTTNNADGGAIWLGPGKTEFTLGRMLRTGILWTVPLILGWDALERFKHLDTHEYKAHKQSISGNYWYLLALGVDPSRKGQGIGGKLMQPILARADDQGLPCFLETLNEINLPIYAKYGFQVKVSGQVPQGGPKYWTMLRPPRPSLEPAAQG